MVHEADSPFSKGWDGGEFKIGGFEYPLGQYSMSVTTRVASHVSGSSYKQKPKAKF